MNEQNRKAVEMTIQPIVQNGSITIKPKKGMDGNERNLLGSLNTLAKCGVVNCDATPDENFRHYTYVFTLANDWEAKLAEYYKQINKQELRKDLDIKTYEENVKANSLAAESNRIAKRANYIAWWAFGIAIVGTIASILIAIFV